MKKSGSKKKRLSPSLSSGNNKRRLPRGNWQKEVDGSIKFAENLLVESPLKL